MHFLIGVELVLLILLVLYMTSQLPGELRCNNCQSTGLRFIDLKGLSPLLDIKRHNTGANGGVLIGIKVVIVIQPFFIGRYKLQESVIG
ncbi:hypothetical protein LINGRAHAP2_LOCUS13893 [Linum grandiflorum]